MTIPLKTTKKGAAAPFLGFSPGLGSCGNCFRLSRRNTDTDLSDRRSGRNTLRLFRLRLERQFVCVRYARQSLLCSGLSTSIRQIFNGRKQNDSHGLSCDWETRSYGRPKGVLTTTTKRQNAERNELFYQARKRYFASSVSFLHTFF